MKEDKAVKVTEEVVEAAVATGNEKVMYIAIGVGAGILGTVAVIKVRKAIKVKKVMKTLEAVEVEED